jgi:hypothetical protein
MRLIKRLSKAGQHTTAAICNCGVWCEVKVSVSYCSSVTGTILQQVGFNIPLRSIFKASYARNCPNPNVSGYFRTTPHKNKTTSKMDFKSIAENIIDLKNADLALRDKLIQSGQLSNGYNKEMKELHNRNAKILNEIIDTIGYPTTDKVGKEASEAAWLVIQHSIGQPDFMKKCMNLLEVAVGENKANPKNLAYLTDRIAVFEGKPQLYGTHFDWDKNGELSPNDFDDLTKVNQRRKSIGLNSLEEQTEIIRKQAEKENQSPPTDLEKRKQEIEEWKKNVGWTK